MFRLEREIYREIRSVFEGEQPTWISSNRYIYLLIYCFYHSVWENP